MPNKPDPQTTTVDQFIWKIICAYNDNVYCEGFSSIKDEKKFFEAARKIIQETFQ